MTPVIKIIDPIFGYEYLDLESAKHFAQRRTDVDTSHTIRGTFKVAQPVFPFHLSIFTLYRFLVEIERCFSPLA